MWDGLLILAGSILPDKMQPANLQVQSDAPIKLSAAEVHSNLLAVVRHFIKL